MPEEIMTNQQSGSYFVHGGLWDIIHMLEDALIGLELRCGRGVGAHGDAKNARK
jgi:hypothetical protein